MLGWPVSSANAQDQTSSVMYGSTGANRRSRTESPSRSAATAEARPWASVSLRARLFSSSIVVSVKRCQKNDSVSWSTFANS